jgi:glycosyltransferase involved in cell wall biosynthesis
MLIRHPERVRRYEEKARAHIRQHYSWDKVVESTEALYQSLTARRR